MASAARIKCRRCVFRPDARLQSFETVDSTDPDQVAALHVHSLAARHAADPRTLLLLAQGWVRTAMGGPDARLGVAESIPNLVNTLDAQAGKAGLQYLDYLGRRIPW